MQRRHTEFPKDGHNMTEHKKLFVSMRFKGMDSEEASRIRSMICNKAQEALHMDFEVIDNFIEDTSHSMEWLLATSLGLLSQADYIYMYGDWYTSDNCRIEREYARKHGIEDITDKI